VRVPSIAELLRAEMTALFGVSRQYRGWHWWSVAKRDRMIDASVHLSCHDEGAGGAKGEAERQGGEACELWVADTGLRLPPTLVARVAAAADVPVAVERLLRYIEDHPHGRR
jgi:hypothetical protein